MTKVLKDIAAQLETYMKGNDFGVSETVKECLAIIDKEVKIDGGNISEIRRQIADLSDGIMVGNELMKLTLK